MVWSIFNGFDVQRQSFFTAMGQKTWIKIVLALINVVFIFAMQAQRCADDNIRNIVKICDPHLANICGSILATLDGNFTNMCR